MAEIKIHPKIKHHISRIANARPKTPKTGEFLKEPLVAAAFLVFGMIALVLSLINFLEALSR